jgi:hypothetical protein
MDKKQVSFSVPRPNLGWAWTFTRKWLLPNPGTLILMIILAIAVPAAIGSPQTQSAVSTSTISYQGRLADSIGTPLTGYYNMEFRIYDVPTGGVPLWEEFWTGGNSVQISDGLFNVMLGSINNTLASAIEGHDELYLGITVGTDSEMTPRVQLGSVPFAMQAMTVPNGSITSEKIADGAVGSSEIATNAVGSDEIAANGVGTAEIANGSVTTEKLAMRAVTQVAQAVISSEVSTTSTTFVNIPGLSTTLTTTGGGLLVFLNLGQIGSPDPTTAWRRVRIVIDGVEKCQGGSELQIFESRPFTLIWYEPSVAAGSHTVRAQYATDAGTVTVSFAGMTSSLTVMELKR